MNIEVNMESKKTKIPKEASLTYLEWEDAVSEASWFTEEGLKNWIASAEQLVRQVGWIVKETKNYIVLVSRLCAVGSGLQDYGMLQKIPKTWIRTHINLTKYVK